jgi:FAD/FMN-containing dehydrogenase
VEDDSRRASSCGSARDRAEVEHDADVADPTMRARFDAARDFAACAPGDLVVRLATLPSRLAATADAARAGLASATGTWLADRRRGVMTLAITTDAPAAALATLVRVVDAHGARLVVERHPETLAPTIAVWHPLPAALPLMRRMKAALDPAGTLAPGRHVGRM